MSNILLLPCAGSLDEFSQLRNIHRICMRSNVEKSFGQWDEEAQQARLQKHYAEFSSSLKFIKQDNQVIGTINFHPKQFKIADEMVSVNFFEQIYVLPDWQGKGVASYAMSSLTPENEEVRLGVLLKDDKAQNFYQKRGYQKYDEDAYQAFLKKLPAPAIRFKP